jgi:hypothetical protein
MKEYLFRWLVRKFLTRFRLRWMLTVMWEEHSSVYYEDNYPTRYDHFERILVRLYDKDCGK